MSFQELNRVFLATPITSLMIKPDFFDPIEQSSIESILSMLRTDLNLEVFCAIEREKYGQELMVGTECTKLDKIGMEQSDVIIALPDSSFGVHLELGWASAMRKPIILLINDRVGEKTPLVEGLSTVTRVHTIRYSSPQVLPTREVWRFELFPQIKEQLRMCDLQLLDQKTNKTFSQLNRESTDGILNQKLVSRRNVEFV